MRAAAPHMDPRPRSRATRGVAVALASRPAVAWLGAAIGLLLWCLPAEAQPIQLTANADPACSSFAPTGNGAGLTPFFESNCDLTGGNPDGNREIFWIEGSGTVVQITDSVACANANPSADSSGTMVAFDSDCDFVGGNADASVEIFVANAGVIDQLTDSSFCTSLAPSMSGDGSVTSFESDCDFNGTNFDRSGEIFKVSSSGVVTQLTDDRTGQGCGSFHAATNFTGTRIAFQSDCDLVGFNPEEIPEIFQVVSDGTIVQLTASADDACASAMPSINAAGDLVAFESDCDFTGENSDGGLEVFSVTDTGLVSQLSASSTDACESMMPSVSASGVLTVYSSYCDPYGSNGDGSFELFVASATAGNQLTNGTDCSSFGSSLTSDGAIATYVSDCDPAAENAVGADQVFQTPVILCGVCGAPVTGRTPPRASDALFILQTAIGAKSCPLCTCDVDSNRAVTATDALKVLRVAVGQAGQLTCSPVAG